MMVTYEMTKKRKATYVKRKEEQQELQEQIQALEQHLAALKAQKDNGTSKLKELYESVAVNEAMKTAVDQHQLAVANAQSLVSQWLQTHSKNPMGFFICLGREWAERRETLLEMKDERLARGFRYVTARCQHLDALKPHFSEEKFEDANGDFCCVRNEVIPFPGVQSMRKVFDAVKFTLDTLEINISEQLGHITVRDDYDAVEADSFTCNYRLTSGIDSGVSTELNAVAFGRYVENPTEFSKEPYAIMAIDSVDQDELHPYHPQECVRKVLNGTVVLVAVPHRQSGVKGQADTQVEIVMLRSFYVKTCRPEFEVSDAVMQELRNNTTRWGEVVLEAVRMRLESVSDEKKGIHS